MSCKTEVTSFPANTFDQPAASNWKQGDGIREVADSLISSLDQGKDLLIAGSAVSSPMTNDSCSGFTFLVPKYPTINIEILPGKKVVQRKSKEGSRIAFLKPDLEVGNVLALTVEQDNGYQHQKQESFRFGYTTCDTRAVSRQESHATGICDTSQPCNGTSCSHSIPSTAHAGSTVIFRRDTDFIDIAVDSPSAGSIDATRIPESMNQSKIYPFIELCGNADCISICENVPLAAIQRLPNRVSRVPEKRHLESKSSSIPSSNSGANGFEFLPYKNQSVQLNTNRKKVRRTSEAGSRHIFFDREIELGMSVILKSVPSPQGPALFRYMFGFTSCDKNRILQDDSHKDDVCSKDVCGGRSYVVGIKYDPAVDSIVTITRTEEFFAFDLKYKHFQKHFPVSSSPTDHWHAFLILSGDVESVEILDPRPGRMNQLSAIPLNLKPSRPVGSLSTPNYPRSLTPTSRTSSAEPSRCSSVADIDCDTQAASGDSGFEFLVTPYPNDSISISHNKRLARRTSSPGSRIVYLNQPLKLGMSVAILTKQTKSPPTPVSFMFGATTCNLQEIKKQDFHVKYPCGNDFPPSECTGKSLKATIKNCSIVGAKVRITRKHHQSFILDLCGLAVQKRFLKWIPASHQACDWIPFLMLTGDVDAVEIVMSKKDDEETCSQMVPAITSFREKCIPALNASTPVKGSSDDRFLDSFSDQKIFVVPSHTSNIRVTGESKVIERETPKHVIGWNIAHLSRPMHVGDKVVFRVERVTKTFRSAPSFQLGFTECDLSDPEKINAHKQSCGRQGICQKSLAQTVAQFATTGAIVSIERSNESIDITVTMNDIQRSYRMKFSNVPKERATFVDPAATYYPFVVLCGISDVLRIVDTDPRRRSDFVPPPDCVINLTPTTRSLQQQDEFKEALTTDSEDEKSCSDNDCSSDSESVPSPPEHAPGKAICGDFPLTKSPAIIPTRNLRENRTAALFVARKWFSNSAVVFKEPLITRVDDSADSKSYVFSTEMRVNESIRFKAVSGGLQKSGHIVFGVTTVPLLQVKMDELPLEASELNLQQDWHVCSNLMSSIGLWDGLTLKRTTTGIKLMLESESEGREIISDIDPIQAVHPFFHFTGCIQSIQILQQEIQPLCLQDRVRLYLIFFYLSFLNRFALKK